MGERSIQEKYQAWRKCPGMNEELLNQLKAMSPDELNDSFYRSLAFGTGGLRGVLGAGENRMNLYTVSKATRGLGRYLLETCEKPSCAVSCDSRIHSRDFELTAATLAEMGIRVYLYRTLMPTPMLSYAVRHLHTSAGVMVTASHNPAKFNGYKVYGADGCQITIEAADRIYSFISAEQTLQPSLPSFQKYLDNGMISYIDDETIESYYQMINGLRIAPTDERLHIVYSPLNGTGNVPVREMLKRMGNIDVDVVAEQEMPDGHFPTCPYPNPEIREAMKLAIDKTIATGADMCVATDPDCDRIGAGVRQGDTVTLIISKGPETTPVTVPKFVGLNIDETLAQLSSYGLTCTASDVEVVDSDKPGGQIVWQSLEPTSKVDEWTTIKFQVSAGLANSSLPITLELPQDGGDVVEVKIYVGDEPNPQYNETVRASDGTVSTTLSGTGKKMVKVYFDGVLDQKQSYERTFG